jgi:voltage-gated potassium channel
VTGDATGEKALIAAGIKKAESLLALLNSDPENLFTVLTARELNPTLHIVARSESVSAESKILRAGADSIISPYASAGRRVADKIMASAQKQHPGIVVDETVLPDLHPGWVEVDEKSGLADHTVEVASGLIEKQILGIRRDGKDILSPPPESQLVIGDKLLVVSTGRQELDEIPPEQPQKIVLVDDNPVIRRLYTRLFQKAGFNIITSSTGREGYEMILREQPDGAVVDYLLGDISGLEVCEAVRESENGQNVKLLLFTADESSELRERAKKVGVDMVVLKSPDAAEIVNLVRAEVESG